MKTLYQAIISEQTSLILKLVISLPESTSTVIDWHDGIKGRVAMLKPEPMWARNIQYVAEIYQPGKRYDYDVTDLGHGLDFKSQPR